MDICFVEVSPIYVREAWSSYFHEQARYFRIMKDGKPLCFYGIITRDPVEGRSLGKGCLPGEAFLMMRTFNGKVLGKGFFISLFAHAFSLGYTELHTWTKWDRLIKLFGRFKKFGIEKTGCPPWDMDSTKTWFIKRGSTFDWESTTDKLNQGN
jgi:hypothetical protein